MFLRTVNGDRVQPIAACTVRLVIAEGHYIVEFIVLSSCSHEIILGWDFLSRNQAVIDCARSEIELFPLYDESNNSNYPAAHKVVVTEDTEIPPTTAALLPVYCTNFHDEAALFEPSSLLLSRKPLLLPYSTLSVSNGTSTLCLINPLSYTIELLKGESLGFVQPIDIGQIYAVQEDSSRSDLDAVSALNPADTPPADLFDSSIADGLSPFERSELLNVLYQFRDSFDVAQPALGRTSAIVHYIDTGSHSPVRQRAYRVSSAERQVITEKVDDMLKRDVIRPSQSPWASPVVLVKKKDGSIRFCVDYLRLNKVTRKDVYPLPRIDDALDCLQGAEFFSSLDLRSGYWQVPLADADRPKTAFVTPDGLYEFNVMLFGLCNAPATFERMMDSILRGLKWQICLCYLDDIFFYCILEINMTKNIANTRLVP